MFVGQLVQTPYGEGIISHIGDNQIIVQPSQWTLANLKKPTFYMNPKDVKPLYSIGSSVSCTFGTGTITAIRDIDHIYEITLSNWRLANGKSPTLYMNQESISLALTGQSTTTATDTDKADFVDHMKKATDAKNEATAAYKKGDLETAKLKYMTALETLQYIRGDLSNKQKSQLFEQTVTNNNNVALCCMRSEDFANCIAFATNSLLLIKSLEKNMPGSLIWQCLTENGITLDQLQKVWKKKALYFIGKAQLKRQNFKEAIESLEEALVLVADDDAHATSANELRDLLKDAKSRLSKEKAKEKSTWSKAFKKGKEEQSSIYHDPMDIEVKSESPTAVASVSPPASSSSKKTGMKPKVPLDPSTIKFDLSGALKTVGSGNEKKSSQVITPKWQPLPFRQYGKYFGVGTLLLGGGISFWWLRLQK